MQEADDPDICPACRESILQGYPNFFGKCHACSMSFFWCEKFCWRRVFDLEVSFLNVKFEFSVTEETLISDIVQAVKKKCSETDGAVQSEDLDLELFVHGKKMDFNAKLGSVWERASASAQWCIKKDTRPQRIQAECKQIAALASQSTRALVKVGKYFVLKSVDFMGNNRYRVKGGDMIPYGEVFPLPDLNINGVKEEDWIKEGEQYKLIKNRKLNTAEIRELEFQKYFVGLHVIVVFEDDAGQEVAYISYVSKLGHSKSQVIYLEDLAACDFDCDSVEETFLKFGEGSFFVRVVDTIWNDFIVEK